MADEDQPPSQQQRHKRDAFSLLLSQSQQQPQQQQQQIQKKRRSSPGATAGAATTANGPAAPRSYAECPVCGLQCPSAFAESHVAACLDRQARAAAAAAAKEAAAKEAAEAAAIEAAAAAAAAKEDNKPSPKPPNQKQKSAFDALRAAAEAQRPNGHVFFLEHCPATSPAAAASWRWHWWPRHGAGARSPAAPPAGSLPEVAWQAVVSIGGGGRGGRSAPSSSSAVEIHLRTNLPSGDGAEIAWDNPLLASNGPPSSSAAQPRWRGSPSALKSALQKNVRLCRPGPAVRAALALLKQGPDLKGQDELLRRLPVICLEDALLHPALPLLVWMMMARGKGWALGGTAGNAVLRVVHQLAAVGVRDYLPPMATAAAGVGGGGGEAEDGGGEVGAQGGGGKAGPSSSPPITLADADARLGLPPAEAALVKALLARAAYGGMGCDVSMLRGYASGWGARFAAAAGGGAAGAAAAADEWWSSPPPPLEAVFGSSEEQQQQRQQQATGPDCSPWLSFIRACYSAAAACPMDGPLPAAAPAPAPAAAQSPAPSGGPPPLTLVGPFTARDVPLSAIDHHVSDVVDHILMPPAAAAAAAATGDAAPPASEVAPPLPSAPAAALQRLASSSWGSEADPRALCARALWLFRSCASRKALLPLLEAFPAGPAAAGPPPLLLPALPPAVAARLRKTSAGAALAAEVDADAAQRERLAEFWAVAAPVADNYARSYLARRFF